MRKAVLIVLAFYQKAVSPYLGVRCRYYPSCSEYTREAVSDRGIWRGLALAVGRILRCHPFAGHGFDPYISRKENKL